MICTVSPTNFTRVSKIQCRMQACYDAHANVCGRVMQRKRPKMSRYRNSEEQTGVSGSGDFRHFHNSCTADVVFVYAIPGVWEKNNNLPWDISYLWKRKNLKSITNLSVGTSQMGWPHSLGDRCRNVPPVLTYSRIILTFCLYVYK